MIIDARPANSLMRRAPHTPLCNSEILSNIESTIKGSLSFSDLTSACDTPAYLGMADVDNCFHRIRIEESLGHLLCQPTSFSARDLGIVGQTRSGVVLQPETRVRVCYHRLPMCFDWSLHLSNTSMKSE